jgi:pimeloyl-ACP methyl ester carboxylesterase
VTASGLFYDRYRANGFDEWLMRIGPGEGPPILFLPPLFEEMNRTRALICGVMRRVAAKGYGCWLPDLPGTGESGRPLETVSWRDWRSAAETAAVYVSHGGRIAATVSIRGGCLLDDAAPAHCGWRFAPVAGSSLVRDLSRAGLASGGGTAGYSPSETLLRPLEQAVPSPLEAVRIVRLASDRAEADSKVPGPPLWRRAEPETSPELSAVIADDILAWIRQCVPS